MSDTTLNKKQEKILEKGGSMNMAGPSMLLFILEE